MKVAWRDKVMYSQKDSSLATVLSGTAASLFDLYIAELNNYPRQVAHSVPGYFQPRCQSISFSAGK